MKNNEIIYESLCNKSYENVLEEALYLTLNIIKNYIENVTPKTPTLDEINEKFKKDTALDLQFKKGFTSLDLNTSTELFPKNDWDHMHDCILDVTYHTTRKNATKEELIEIFNKLPMDLKADAYEFGMSDTVWRDNFIEWYEENF